MASNVVPLRPPADELIRLPHSIEAEQTILGSAMVNNAVLDACPWLEPADFFEPVHGRIWASCQAERALGRTADAVTLKRLFDADPALQELDGAQYLARMARAAETVFRAADYARLVKRYARLRELSTIGREVAALAEADGVEDPASIWAGFAKRLDAVLVDDGKPVARHIAQVCTAILHEMEHPPAVWSTGIPALDESLGGGIQEGHVLGFEAKAKNFKSGCCHSVLVALAQQCVPSAYLAFEMGSARLAKRMLGHVGGFNSAMFKHVDERTVDIAGRAMQKISALPLWIADCPGWRFSRMRAAANQLMLGHGVRVFVLDYWQLVGRDDPKESMASHLAEVAQWCADHAHEHGTSWIIASQQNRQGESYASDGLVKACDWHAVLRKHEQKTILGDRSVETLWMEVGYARDSAGDNIGDENLPVLYIDPHGPHLAQLPGA